MYQILETDRLVIRPIALTDAAFIKELVNSKGWLEFIGDRNITTTSDAEDYINSILDKPQFYYSIFHLKTTEQPVGLISFLKRDDQKFPDIGFAILPDFEKQGYTFEAAKTYLEEIIKTGTFDNVIAITNPNNKKSIALLLKLGLHIDTLQRGENENLLLFKMKS